MRAATRRIGATYDAALAPLGINIAQYSLLRKIQRLQPVSLTDLGRESELERSTISRNVQVLERMELVTTGRGKRDLRESMVWLADPGEAMLARATPLWNACQKDIETRLGAEGLSTLQNILKIL